MVWERHTEVILLDMFHILSLRRTRKRAAPPQPQAPFVCGTQNDTFQHANIPERLPRAEQTFDCSQQRLRVADVPLNRWRLVAQELCG